MQLKKRFVNAATSHLPKRLRREHEDEDLDELQMLPSGMSEADMSMHNILKDLVFSCGVAFAQVTLGHHQNAFLYAFGQAIK